MKESQLKDQFTEWLEHPVTEVFLRYLKDSAKEEADLITDLIMNGGNVNEQDQIRVSTTCLLLNQISEIEIDEINEFYEEKK